MNLTIQSLHSITPAQLIHLAAITQSERYERISDSTYQFKQAQPHPDVASYCFANNIDYGYVENNQKLTNFGLVAMDMDSTLISIECIDEIADMQGLKAQVSTITEAAMRGEIDFAESLRRRVSLLKGLSEDALQHVYDQRLQLNPGAETLIAELKKNHIKTLLMSGGFVFFTERLKQRLNLDFAYANTLEIIDGKLTGFILGDILDAQSKADILVKTRAALKLQPEQVIAIGDGANDLKMMAAAGLSIAYHAKPLVRKQASYALNFVGLDGLVNLLK
jgi:phosphoserine phosphatase